MITQETFTVQALDGITRRYDQSGKRVALGSDTAVDITLKSETPLASHVVVANEKYRSLMEKRA